MPKYKILKNEKIDFCDRTLYRIKALKDFTLIDGKEIKAGDLGGYVESKKNLSQKGNCWICKNAWVFDNAKVYDNAYVFDIKNPTVFSKAIDYNSDDGCLMIKGDAYVRSNNDYLFITKLGRYKYNTIFYKCKNGHVGVVRGGFNGTLDEFISEVKDTFEERECLTAVEAVKIHFDLV